MRKALKKSNTFYGWFIVAASFILMASAMGIAYNCASLFIKPVSEDLGFTRQQINMTVTIRFVCQMILAFLSGKIFVRYNIKRLMQVSSIVLAVSYFCYSFSNTLLTYYIITCIVSFSVVLLTVLPLSLILSNWFYERRGLTIGIAFMGSGVGGMIFNSLCGIWLTSFGWRITYQILAVLMFLMIAPCVFFIIRIYPKDIGLSPLGNSDESNVLNDAIDEEGLLLTDAAKTIQFWLISICAVTVSMSVNTLMLNISPHLTDIGYSTKFSANIVAMCMGSLAIFKVVLGQLYDKLGISKATIISSLATLFGLIALVFADFYIVLPILIVCVGLGGSAGTMSNPIIAQNMFGRRDYSAIYGFLTAVSSIGGIIGPIINGYVFDMKGSYNIAFITMGIVILITIGIYQFIFTKMKKKEDQIEAII